MNYYDIPQIIIRTKEYNVYRIGKSFRIYSNTNSKITPYIISSNIIYHTIYHDFYHIIPDYYRVLGIDLNTTDIINEWLWNEGILTFYLDYINGNPTNYDMLRFQTNIIYHMNVKIENNEIISIRI